MNGPLSVAVAATAFVGSHFLLSHPWRAPLVRRLGPGGFQAVYSIVAALTLAWLVRAYLHAPPSVPLWPVGDTLWAIATIVMLLASVLLLGSLIRNPAFPGPDAERLARAEPAGVFAITRHPMMWSFALWGASHVLIYPYVGNIVLCLAIIVLALVGAAMQDRKKRALAPGSWPAWEVRTSFWPFAAIAAGRARASRFGIHTLAGGLVVWLAASWAHIPLAGWRAGIWRWIG